MTATFPDGTTRWLLKMSDWDFAWQEDYSFKEPIKLPAGTRLDALISYDNSEENPHQPTHPPKRVRWGPTSTDEMGTLTLSVMFDQPEQKAVMHAALKRKLIEQFVDRLFEGDEHSFALVRGGPRSEMKQQYEAARFPLLLLDKNGDKILDAEERQPAIDFILNSGAMEGIGSIGFD
jgi:hypothetical protein